MKTIIILSTLASLLYLSSMEKENILCQPEISIKASIRGWYNLQVNDSLYMSGSDIIYYYLFEVKLVNNSKSSFEFLTYSCGTGANVVVDQKYISVCANNCVNNKITPIRLEPKQEVSVLGILKTKKMFSQTKVKIGWILISLKNTDSFNFNNILERSRSRLENVIWSDPINLQFAGNINYEIKN